MPRDSERIPRIMAALERLWLTYPDMRLGQLLDNLFFMSDTGKHLFYLEDEESEQAIDKAMQVGL